MSWTDGFEIEQLKKRLDAAEAELKVHRMAISMLADGLHLDAADVLRAAQRQGADK